MLVLLILHGLTINELFTDSSSPLITSLIRYLSLTFFWFGKSDPEVRILSIIQVLMRDSKITMNGSGVVLMVEKRSMNKVNDAVPYPSSYWEISVQ